MSISKVSYLLGKKQNDNTGEFKRNTFYQIRTKLLDKYPALLGDKIDTVYFMEKYEVEEASYYGIIWTRSDTVNYSFFAHEVKLSNKKSFTTKAISLISTWDTTSVRNEEMKYPNSPRTVYAARGIVIKDKCLIDTMRMKDLIFE